MILKYKDFKMLSTDDMKQIVGGNYPTCHPQSGCGSYEGQNQYICGCRRTDTECWVDYCYCNGQPIPGGCDVKVYCEDFEW